MVCIAATHGGERRVAVNCAAALASSGLLGGENGVGDISGSRFGPKGERRVTSKLSGEADGPRKTLTRMSLDYFSTLSPFFRSANRRSGTLTAAAMNRVDAWRMIQRRGAAIDMVVKIGCHTFRATGITAYLEAGGTLENAQAMAAHENPRTTKLYDRTGDAITLDEVERIAI